MFLDMEIYFDRSGRIYYPGDTITCTIDVESMFKIKCKYVKVRLRCPYRKSNVEEFRIYGIADQRINKTSGHSNFKIGDKGWCLVFVFVHYIECIFVFVYPFICC